MSYQYYGGGGAYSMPDYASDDIPGNWPQQNQYGPPQQQQRGPSMRPDYNTAGYDGRYPPPQQQQHYAPNPPNPSSQNWYDNNAYSGASYSPTGQWALPGRPLVEQARNNSPTGSPRAAPQRPPRPDYQEQLWEPPRQPSHGPPGNGAYPQSLPQQSHHGSGQWTGDGYSSAQSYYPTGHPPRQPPQPSNVLDYTISQQMQQAFGATPRNQRAPLGPPPSARRGPASYYPRIAPVHPIAEEADSVRGSVHQTSSTNLAHSSYASSSALPPPEFPSQYRDSAASIPESTDERYTPIESVPESGRESAGEERDQPSPDPSTLIRQASLGKKSTPTLTTIKNSGSVKETTPPNGLSGLPSQQRAAAAAATAAAATELTSPFDKEIDDSGASGDVSPLSEDARSLVDDKDLDAGIFAALEATPTKKVAVDADDAGLDPSTDQIGHHRHSSNVLGVPSPLEAPSSGLFTGGDARSTTSEDSMATAVAPATPIEPDTISPADETNTAEARQSIIGSLERGGALSPAVTDSLKSPTEGFSSRSGKKRNPKLNVDMDAVRDAEKRGSMTSLPDLIKRATRLASNLDRGKTASRLGMNFFDGNDGEAHEKHMRDLRDRRSGSLSNILASFPAAGTKDGEKRKSFGNFSSHLRHSTLASDSDSGERTSKSRRRCCGMPLWAFILLLIVIVLLVAAAIIIPVVLVVVPKQHNMNNKSSGAAQLEQCRMSLHCEHGGTNVVGDNGSCSCLCANGYTGNTCTVLSGAGCVTTTVGGNSAATVGDLIPPLLSGAETDFSIPLDGQTLLGLFSSNQLSCAAENALVTFNNVGKRAAIPQGNFGPQNHPTPTFTGNPFQNSAAATSNGIVFQSGSPSAITSTTTPKAATTTNAPATTDASSPSAVTSSPISSPGSSTGSDNGSNSGSSSISSSSSSSSSDSGSSSSSSSGSGTGSGPGSSSGSNATNTIDFAGVAVLYIFQVSEQANTAATAQQNLQSYFTSGETTSGQTIDPQNIDLGDGYSCNINSFSLHLANGTTVGGSN